MAVQGTKAIAYNQLKPLENNNASAIVEEHIRYWRKYNDDLDAQRRAEEARDAQDASKKAAAQGLQNEKYLSKIKLGESAGYKREQIVSDFENNRSRLADIARQAAAGDTDSIMLLDSEMLKYNELTSLDKTIATISKERLKGGRDHKDFNPATDEPIMQLLEAFVDGQYMVKNGDLVIPDPKDPTKTIKRSPADIKGFLLNSNFSGKFDPTKFGSEIAGTIKLEDNNGNRRLTQDIKRSAELKVLNGFEQNDIALRSYAFQMKNMEGENNPFKNLDINKLTKTEITALATKFAEDEVFKNLQTSNNWLNNAVKQKSLKDENEVTTTVRLNEDGTPVRDIIWKGEKRTLAQGNLIIGFDTGKPKNVVNEKGQTVQPTNILYNPYNNRISILGKHVEEVQEIARDGKGNIIPKMNSKGQTFSNEDGSIIPETVFKTKVIEDTTVEDAATVGNVVTQTINPKTNRKFKNLEEATEYYKSIAPEQPVKKSSEPTTNDYGI